MMFIQQLLYYLFQNMIRSGSKSQQQTLEQQLRHGNLLLKVTQCIKFEQIRVLCLSGYLISSPFKLLSEKCIHLEVLDLSNNSGLQLLDVQSNMHKLKKLRSLDLNRTQLRSIPSKKAFRSMQCLQMLRLHDNYLTDQDETLEALVQCTTLELLTLDGNPFSQGNRLLRLDVFAVLPFLKVLDNNVVTDDEVHPYLARSTIRFRSLSNFSKVDLPAVTCLTNAPCNCNYYKDGKIRLQSEEAVEAISKDVPLPQAHQIDQFEKQIAYLRMLQRRNSAIMYMQLSLRNNLKRGEEVLQYNKLQRAVLKFQSIWRSYRVRRDLNSEVDAVMKEEGYHHLTVPASQLKEAYALKFNLARLRPFVRIWVAKRKERIAAAKIQKIFRGFNVRNSLWWLPEKLDLLTRPRILFLQDQTSMLKKLLQDNLSSINEDSPLHNVAEHLTQNTKYHLIKTVDAGQKMPENQISTIFFASAKTNLKFDRGLPTPIKQGKSIYDLSNRFSEFHGNKDVLKKLGIPHKTITEFERLVASSKHHLSRFGIRNLREYRVYQERQKLLQRDPDDVDPLKKMLQAHRFEQSRLVQLELDPLEMVHLIKVILKYNSTNFPKLQVMFEPLLDRQAAAHKIQTSFRSFLRRKMLRFAMLELESDQNEFQRLTSKMDQDFLRFYQNQLTIRTNTKWTHSLHQDAFKMNEVIFVRELVKRRAVYRIQQLWKWYKFKSRVQLLANIAKYLAQFKNATQLYLNEDVYEHLHKIVEANSQERKYVKPAQKFQFCFEEIKGFPGNWNIQLQRQDYSDWFNNVRLKDYPVPLWVVNKVQNGKGQLDYGLGSQYKNNLDAIVHRSCADYSNKVLDYNDIVTTDVKRFSIRNGLRFVEINVASPGDALRRALALYLLTASRKTSKFVKLFTKNMLASTESLGDLRDQWQMCGNHQSNSSYLSFLLQSGQTFKNFDAVFPRHNFCSEAQQKASHSGLILSEKNQPVTTEVGDANRLANKIQDVIKFSDRVSFDQELVFNLRDNNKTIFLKRVQKNDPFCRIFANHTKDLYTIENQDTASESWVYQPFPTYERDGTDAKGIATLREQQYTQMFRPESSALQPPKTLSQQNFQFRSTSNLRACLDPLPSNNKNSHMGTLRGNQSEQDLLSIHQGSLHTLQPRDFTGARQSMPSVLARQNNEHPGRMFADQASQVYGQNTYANYPQEKAKPQSGAVARYGKGRQNFKSLYQTKDGNADLNLRGVRNMGRKVSITAGGQGTSPAKKGGFTLRNGSVHVTGRNKNLPHVATGDTVVASYQQGVEKSTNADSKSVLQHVRGHTSSRYPDDKSTSVGFDQSRGAPSHIPASDAKDHYSAKGFEYDKLSYGLLRGGSAAWMHNSASQLPSVLPRPDSAAARAEKTVRVKTANAVCQIVRDRYNQDKSMLLAEFNERTKEQKGLQYQIIANRKMVDLAVNQQKRHQAVHVCHSKKKAADDSKKTAMSLAQVAHVITKIDVQRSLKQRAQQVDKLRAQKKDLRRSAKPTQPVKELKTKQFWADQL